MLTCLRVLQKRHQDGADCICRAGKGSQKKERKKLPEKRKKKKNSPFNTGPWHNNPSKEQRKTNIQAVVYHRIYRNRPAKIAAKMALTYRAGTGLLRPHHPAASTRFLSGAGPCKAGLLVCPRLLPKAYFADDSRAPVPHDSTHLARRTAPRTAAAAGVAIAWSRTPDSVHRGGTVGSGYT